MVHFSPGESHPQALADPYMNRSIHTALLIQSISTIDFALIQRLLPFLVDLILKPDEPTPSLHPHYRDFITNTGWSAPVPRIGTLILVGPLLAFLPYH